MIHSKKIVTAVFALLSSILVYGVSPVTKVGAYPAPAGLDGRNIALWQSHGQYYNNDKQQWLWQRAPLMQTIEDLYSASYVIDLLTPMLENAGAYVMLPRERDTSTFEVIIDRDSDMTPGYSETTGANSWQSTTTTKGYAKRSETLSGTVNPFRQGSARIVKTVANPSSESTARWQAEIPEAGTYSLYISYPTLPNSSSAVTYRVNSQRGTEVFTVDQTMGGGTWIRLGEFPFAAGKTDLPTVEMTNVATGTNVGKVVAADAIKIGGGMGQVVRGTGESASTSGKPSWMEASRYYLQSAGMPESVYAPAEGSNDYSQDFRSRPLWVNYLAGGSARAPREKGLNIPIDLALALHTDAGVTPDTTIIGTLGIYSTDGGTRLGDGRRRTTNRDLTESVVNSIVNDLQAIYQPDWTKRKIRDRKYAEARIPLVPSTLIELLSHQNYADMTLGQDPQFRFDAARAIYKGILRYLAANGKRRYVVQPLPVNSFAINSDADGHFTLSWKATVDSLEPTATPTEYVIEQRIGDGAFIALKAVSSTSFKFKADPGVVYSFRVIAANDGGLAFPSEVLSACHFDNDNPEVLIVNGFTRLSAPESFDAEGEAGFLDAIDHGVPYMRNIAYTGSQYNFDRESPWVDDVIDPGFGASKVDYIETIEAGNTFDYPYIHGSALAASRYSFTSTSLDAYLDPANRFDQKIVDLILGKQKETRRGNGTNLPNKFKAFPVELQQRLTQHILCGGNLLVSGSYVGSDLFENQYSDDETRSRDTEFARRVLGIEHEASFASVSGIIDVLPFWANDFTESRVAYSNLPNEKIYAVESPDAIVAAKPSESSSTIMVYNENGQSAAVATYDGHNSVIVMGFPFETIVNNGSRNALMEEFMHFLTTVKQKIIKLPNQMPDVDVSLATDTPAGKPSSL